MRPAIQAVGDQYSEKGWTGGLMVGIPAGLAEFEFEIKPDPRRNYRAPATAVKTRRFSFLNTWLWKNSQLSLAYQFWIIKPTFIVQRLFWTENRLFIKLSLVLKLKIQQFIEIFRTRCPNYSPSTFGAWSERLCWWAWAEGSWSPRVIGNKSCSNKRLHANSVPFDK